MIKLTEKMIFKCVCWELGIAQENQSEFTLISISPTKQVFTVILCFTTKLQYKNSRTSKPPSKLRMPPKMAMATKL